MNAAIFNQNNIQSFNTQQHTISLHLQFTKSLDSTFLSFQMQSD